MLLNTIESFGKIFFYIAGPLAAWTALFTWKRELKGKVKHDISRELLALVITVRSFLSAAQLSSQAVSSRKNKIGNYKWLHDSFSKASQISLDVKVHWNRGEPKLVNELLNLLISLDVIVSSYDPADLIEDKFGVDIEQVRSYLKIIEGKDSEFNSEAEKVFSAIEDKFRKYVQ